jgi:hypothetical protein
MEASKTFEHIGAARHYEGTLRIDIKTMQAVIARSDVARLLERWPVEIFDISDVMRSAGTPQAVGKAWITRSGKAVMYTINGTKYVSPLTQVKGTISGARKFANVSIMKEAGVPALSSSPAGVPA